MIISVRHTIIFIFLLAGSRYASAQSSYFNLTIDNGLPSNKVYSTITDHLGYLWIATDNGVVKYNGYDFKIFTTQDGLPKNDVWQLLEDSKGRIWLGCIAERFGYIYNDKYYNAKIATPSHSSIYPVGLSCFEDHIMFVSSYMANTYHPSLCVERNDTIYTINIAEKLKRIEPSIKLTDHGNFTIINILLSNNISPKVIYTDKLYDAKIINNDSIEFKKINLTTKNIKNFLLPDVTATKKKLIYTSQFNGKIQLNTFDWRTLSYDSIDITKIVDTSTFLNISYNASDIEKNNLYLFSKNKITEIILNPRLAFQTSISLPSSVNKLNINTAYRLKKWGFSIATPNNGLFLGYTKGGFFKKYNSLVGHKYVGGDYNEAFWVDPNYRYILRVTNKIEKIPTPFNFKITLIKKQDENNYYVFGQRNWTLNLRSKQWTVNDDSLFCLSILSAHRRSVDDWYCVSNFSFYHIDPLHGRNDIAIDISRYNNLLYDKLRDRYIAYNNNSVLFFDPKTKHKIKFQEEALKSKFGISEIQDIHVDTTYGNIIINGGGLLFVYDSDHENFNKIAEDLNLVNCRTALHKNTLIVYGRFGIRFYELLGKNRLSKPITYYNFKTLEYSFIESAQPISDNIFLNTNKGTYKIAIPNFDTILNETSNKYFQPIYYYKNNISKLNTGDTIKIDPELPVIRFDNINPFGDGKSLFSVHTKDSSITLNGTEFNIPQEMLKPDNSYNLTISSSDLSWKSEPINFTIYIVPKWYQTKTMVSIIWTVCILIFILAISISILITRRLVLNATKKRNARMELELKSIYAQINPHFIFNSLNSALLLVSKNKTEDAYTHISKFSKLLRSYIKSSRNKLILLSDEIKNLTNYIDLQQVRFRDRFNYQINVASDVDVNVIRIPSLLLQPFVENAIEHGLLSKEQQGNLSVSFNIKNEKLVCIIEDDGIGRKESKANKIPNPIKDESYGELLIKDLINIFNKYEHMNIHIEYQDKMPPLSGTIVTIFINTAHN